RAGAAAADRGPAPARAAPASARGGRGPGATRPRARGLWRRRGAGPRGPGRAAQAARRARDRGAARSADAVPRAARSVGRPDRLRRGDRLGQRRDRRPEPSTGASLDRRAVARARRADRASPGDSPLDRGGAAGRGAMTELDPDQLPRAVAIVGPTASGKSRLALALAERFDRSILCCDSVQVYRGLDIGSAKPSAEERRRVPHELLDLVDPDQAFS